MSNPNFENRIQEAVETYLNRDDVQRTIAVNRIEDRIVNSLENLGYPVTVSKREEIRKYAEASWAADSDLQDTSK